MSCEEFLPTINAWMDGQLSESEAVEVQAHVSQCAACQKFTEELRLVDGQLRELFAEDREKSQQVASRVAHQIPLQVSGSKLSESTLEQNSNSGSSSGASRWSSHLNLFLAVAVGFLFAVFLFEPWKEPAPRFVEHEPRILVGSDPVATVQLATGPIQVAKPDSAWEPYSSNSPIEFGCRIRTSESDSCEVQTSSKATVRMATATCVSFDEPANVALEKGKVWCQSNLDELDVQTPNSLVCVKGTCEIRHESGKTEILVIDGLANLKCPTWEKEITGPRRVRFSNGMTPEEDQLGDVVAETSWMHGILAKKGADNAEFQQRINQLLGALGRAKMSYLYESEIRQMGDQCSKPLSLFICQSAEVVAESNRRIAAARILADIAGPQSVPELVELLKDHEGEVRFHAARCLQRLTGNGLRIPPESWRQTSVQQQQAEIKRFSHWFESQNIRRLKGSS